MEIAGPSRDQADDTQIGRIGSRFGYKIAERPRDCRARPGNIRTWSAKIPKREGFAEDSGTLTRIDEVSHKRIIQNGDLSL